MRAERPDARPSTQASRQLRAVQVATLGHRLPQQNVIYELRTTQQITSVARAPHCRVIWDGKSPYFLLHFDGEPPTGHNARSSPIRYADGTGDELTMRFRAPEESGPTTTTAG